MTFDCLTLNPAVGICISDDGFWADIVQHMTDDECLHQSLHDWSPSHPGRIVRRWGAYDAAAHSFQHQTPLVCISVGRGSVHNGEISATETVSIGSSRLSANAGFLLPRQADAFCAAIKHGWHESSRVPPG